MCSAPFLVVCVTTTIGTDIRPHWHKQGNIRISPIPRATRSAYHTAQTAWKVLTLNLCRRMCRRNTRSQISPWVQVLLADQPFPRHCRMASQVGTSAKQLSMRTMVSNRSIITKKTWEFYFKDPLTKTPYVLEPETGLGSCSKGWCAGSGWDSLDAKSQVPQAQCPSRLMVSQSRSWGGISLFSVLQIKFPRLFFFSPCRFHQTSPISV